MSDENEKTTEDKKEFSFKAETSPEDAAKIREFLGEEDSPYEELQKEKEAEKKAKDKPKSMPGDFQDRIYEPIKNSDIINPGSLSGLDGYISSSPADKQKYLKAVLNDKPVVLDVELAGGEFKVKIRSKTAWEQTLAYEAALADQDEKVVSDYYQAMIQMQKYGCMIQVQSINGETFSTTEYVRPKDGEWRKQRQELRDRAVEVMDNMNSARMTMLLNALRIFEYKLAEMTAACNDENFWKPAG